MFLPYVYIPPENKEYIRELFAKLEETQKKQEAFHDEWEANTDMSLEADYHDRYDAMTKICDDLIDEIRSYNGDI